MELLKGNQGKSEGGFTLIELLVVIGILAVLAAVAIPAYSRFFGEGEVEANAAELSNIQASMDAMMAHWRLQYVVAQGDPVALFDQLPEGAIDADGDTTGMVLNEDYEVLHPAFLRIGSVATAPTKTCYTWDSTGFVTQHADLVPDENGDC